jgi:hypothetical protein
VVEAYAERELWPDYIEAFEEAMEKDEHQARSVARDPIRPQVVPEPGHLRDRCADTLEDMDLKLPPRQVDIAEIRRQYHAAAEEQERRDHKSPKASHKK